MPSPFTLPIVAGLTIVGGLSGIWLGHSAIDQVNPFFFSEPETRFHADAVPYRSPDWAQVNAAEQAQAMEGEITSCVGCLNWPQEYRPVRDSAFRILDASQSGWPASVSTVVPASAAASTQAPEPAPLAAEHDPDWQRVQAYSSYPIDARQRRAAPAEPEDETMAADEEPVDADDEGGSE